MAGDVAAPQRMKDAVQRCVDAHGRELHGLSRDIWSRPELAGGEAHAHDRLVRFFSRDGSWTVRGHYKLPTAFRASWGPVGGADGGGGPALNVGFLCEYDALPGIGHACGHNLIAEVGAAAALGLKAALEGQAGLPVPVKVTTSPENHKTTKPQIHRSDQQVTPFHEQSKVAAGESGQMLFFYSPLE